MRASLAQDERFTRITRRAARHRGGLPEPQLLLRTPNGVFTSGDAQRRFHAASVGKLFTTTLAFQLVEAGRLDFDAPVRDLLPRQEWDGVVDPRATARQLASHTSGAADYFEGPVLSGNRFLPRMLVEPDRFLTPNDLLDFSRERQRPLSPPGARFSYSDTGYILLGRIIEEVGQASFAEQLHQRVFEPAGMTDSCLTFYSWPGGELVRERPADVLQRLDLAPLVVNKVDVSRAPVLSCDWSGGGVATTLADLDRYAQAWADGSLLSEGSRQTMTLMQHRFRSGIRYGTGMMELHYGGFSPFLARMPHTIGHLGVTGAHLFFSPDARYTIVLNTHSTAQMVRSFQLHISLLRAALR